MEGLGGDKLFGDRFFAQHVAFAYYWIVVALYMANPRIAYNLNRHVEEHARDTYQAFVEEEADWLKEQVGTVRYGTVLYCALRYCRVGDHGPTSDLQPQRSCRAAVVCSLARSTNGSPLAQAFTGHLHAPTRLGTPASHPWDPYLASDHLPPHV